MYLVDFMTTFTVSHAQMVEFSLAFFDILELLLSKWKFHVPILPNMIGTHDLMSNFWMIQDFNIFWYVLHMFFSAEQAKEKCENMINE